MSKNNGNRSSTPRKGGGSMFAGILLGMVLGLAIAAGVAWYIMKTPKPFVDKEQRRELPAAETRAPLAGLPQAPASAPAAASGVADDGKPRFEFYKVLTDKQDAAGAAPAPAPKDGSQKDGAKVAQDSKPAAPKAASNQSYFLQAGSFSNESDADKVKAKLALLGMEASVQTVTIPDKGVWHRVRLGPYRSQDEMNKARAVLKQNGVDAAPMRDQ